MNNEIFILENFDIFLFSIIFPYEKSFVFKKMTIKFKEQAIERVLSIPNLFSPLQIDSFKDSKSLALTNLKEIADGILILNFGTVNIELLVDIKTKTALSIIEQSLSKLGRIKNEKAYKNFLPTLCVPYLTKDIIERLEKNSISGIDLNGNYYITSPKFIAIRLDQKNLFREKRTIKDIYSRNSSLISRLLLKEKKLQNNLNSISNQLKLLGQQLSLSTISKVLKILEEDLIISRNGNEIRLIQPNILLDKLLEGYRKPEFLSTTYLKLPDNRLEVKKILDNAIGINNWILTGESSAEKYTSTTPEYIRRVYYLTRLDKSLERYIDNKFYNYILFSTRDKYLFFDSQEFYSSRIQAFIELSLLGKREKEIAEDIKKDILNE